MGSGQDTPGRAGRARTIQDKTAVCRVLRVLSFAVMDTARVAQWSPPLSAKRLCISERSCLGRRELSLPVCCRAVYEKWGMS
eukprot:277367-Chlamydomonas_euryale.AAC.1